MRGTKSKESVFLKESVVPQAKFHKRAAEARGQNHLYCMWPERVQEAQRGLHPDATILSMPSLMPLPDLPKIYMESHRAAAQVVRAKANGIGGDALRIITARWNFWEGVFKDAIPLREYDRFCSENFPMESQSCWHSSTLPLGFRWAGFEDLVQLEGLLYPGYRRSASGPSLFRQRCYEADFVLLVATELDRGIWAFCIGNYENPESSEGLRSSWLWVRPEVRRRGVGTYVVEGMGNVDTILSATVRSQKERSFWETFLPRAQVQDFGALAF